MRMMIDHVGRTGKVTAVTFDTDNETYYLGRGNYDVWIYAEQTRDVTSVICDLKNIGYRELDAETFKPYGYIEIRDREVGV